MKPGDLVWLRDERGFVADDDGQPISFHITRQRHDAAGTWHQLANEHRTAQAIYGGWHTAPRLAYAFPEQNENR